MGRTASAGLQQLVAEAAGVEGRLGPAGDAAAGAETGIVSGFGALSVVEARSCSPSVMVSSSMAVRMTGPVSAMPRRSTSRDSTEFRPSIVACMRWSAEIWRARRSSRSARNASILTDAGPCPLTVSERALRVARSTAASTDVSSRSETICVSSSPIVRSRLATAGSAPRVSSRSARVTTWLSRASRLPPPAPTRSTFSARPRSEHASRRGRPRAPPAGAGSRRSSRAGRSGPGPD